MTDGSCRLQLSLVFLNAEKINQVVRSLYGSNVFKKAGPPSLADTFSLKLAVRTLPNHSSI